MNFSDIQFIFNRALSLTLDRTKLFLTFVVLSLCGVLVVFCRGLAEHANSWVAMSLKFLPVFLCSGILLALGIILIRGYHDEIKKKEVDYYKILSNSWQTMLGAAYFTIPVILLYLMLWILLGIFLFLSTLPSIGDFFSVILVVAPFLINLATLMLCTFVIATLFYVAPVVALKGLNQSLVSEILAKRIQGDIFTNVMLFLIGIFPFILYFGFLFLAALMTGSVCFFCKDLLRTVLQWFFLMIPFAALLSPAIIFFFNFAAEAHVLMHKRLKSGI